MQKNKSICVEEELKIFQKKFEKTMNKHEKIMINSLKKLFQCSTIDYEKLNNMRDKEKIEYLITKIEDIKNNSNKSFSILHKNLIEDFVNKYADNLYECVDFYNCYKNNNDYDDYNKELKIFQKKFEKTMDKHEKIMINSLKKLFQCSMIDYEKLNNISDKEKIEYLITKIEDIKNNSDKSFSILHKNLIEDFVNKYADNLYECVGFYCYNNEYNYIIKDEEDYAIEDDEEDYTVEEEDYTVEEEDYTVEEDYTIEDDEEDYTVEEEDYTIEDDEEDYTVDYGKKNCTLNYKNCTVNYNKEDCTVEYDEENDTCVINIIADLFKNPWESYEDGYRDGYNNRSYNEYNEDYLRGYKRGEMEREDDDEEERIRQEEYEE